MQDTISLVLGEYPSYFYKHHHAQKEVTCLHKHLNIWSSVSSSFMALQYKDISAHSNLSHGESGVLPCVLLQKVVFCCLVQKVVFYLVSCRKWCPRMHTRLVTCLQPQVDWSNGQWVLQLFTTVLTVESSFSKGKNPLFYGEIGRRTGKSAY